MSQQVSDATSRLQLRRRDQRRRRGRTWLLGGLALVLLLGLAYVVGFSPALSARAVTVNGAKVLSKTEVLDAAAVAAGTPLVWVDAAKVAQRVSGLPAVADLGITTMSQALRPTVTDVTVLPAADGDEPDVRFTLRPSTTERH